ncbi:MAG TPA: aspartate ammonia-lyase [Marinilabiliales bacterium]|jgi:aspartate ammonia-lyase|nr:MAG: aspartate ammonia-lyase [Bacteroidetes bacterium GWA2_40_14]OFX59162.1 MAG: aspartate ammonia-lyase [Bacteroidetes bacterium GWC2_40_13]OFX73115.1 MAG: aspartate ammonia-lyase [Bacteroidetes bacterium GWD2_40_43]OFX95143.1 MAG: aspartate ammonia-lyase [Bacteroidetes bacterium GWE2_40_63]OFY19226.1 MAG: aspartate ammonia-lyase [Bacteroidetes bacterium GWF2_40_13]OFZ30808.1 MAG: aspartate ammonia-lyase [Bacteroidetes bacterium RIFOXYC2_FULL_40_12]HAM97296.1 aspartate ammonia-lyase [Mari
MRIESDFLGEKHIHQDAYYGIHSVRARENFPDKTAFPVEWYRAMGIVKQACYQTVWSFKKAVAQKNPTKLQQLKLPDDQVLQSMIDACGQIGQGHFYNNFVVPAIQGGAGTSINMNINEIIANIALEKMGHLKGSYAIIDPIEQANIYQSTNDVVPTALKVAVLRMLNQLEESINEMRKPLETLEKQYRQNLRTGFTQMQQAVPSSFGHLFGAYNEAFSRDWWRVSKCFERIKTVNLGGGAIGSGIAIPRFYIVEVVLELKKLTGLPVTQNENLTESTSNLDSFVEVHAILKAHAVTLEKMVTDLRLLSSDLMQQKEIQLPPRQAGSSIMPGKINPVIPEFVITSAHRVYSNDMLITQLAAMGTLELNAYLPMIGHAMIESLNLLIGCNQTLANNLLSGLTIDVKRATENLYLSPSVCTALVPTIGYHQAAILSKTMRDNSCTIFEANVICGLLDNKLLKKYMEPGMLLQKGFSINDI